MLTALEACLSPFEYAFSYIFVAYYRVTTTAYYYYLGCFDDETFLFNRNFQWKYKTS